MFKFIDFIILNFQTTLNVHIVNTKVAVVGEIYKQFFLCLKSFQALKIHFKFFDFDIQICKQFRNETTKMESLGDLKLVVEYTTTELTSSPGWELVLVVPGLKVLFFSPGLPQPGLKILPALKKIPPTAAPCEIRTQDLMHCLARSLPPPPKQHI